MPLSEQAKARRRAKRASSRQAKRLSKAGMPMPRKSRTTRKNGPRRGPSRQKGFIADALGNLGQTIGGMGDNLLGGLFNPRGAPVALSGQRKAVVEDQKSLRGTDEIGVFVVPAGTPSGTIIARDMMSPSQLGTRLSIFASLWKRMILYEMVFEIVTSNPSTNSGSYVLATDPDPVQTYYDNSETPKRLMALKNAQTSNSWCPAMVNVEVTDQALYTDIGDLRSISDAEVRQHAAGQYVLAVSAPSNAINTYTLLCHWSVLGLQSDVPNLLPPPGTTVDVATTGKQVAASTNNTVVLASVDVFGSVPSIPPVGTYKVAPGTLKLKLAVPGAGDKGPLNVLSVEVAGSGTIFTCDVSAFGSLAQVKSVSGQFPSVYELRITSIAFNSVKSGYATTNQWYADASNHEEWMLNSMRQQRAEEMKALVRQELDVRARTRLAELTQHELLAISGEVGSISAEIVDVAELTIGMRNLDLGNSSMDWD